MSWGGTDEAGQTLLKRIAARNLRYDAALHGPLDEDAAPGAAALLAALTDPVPVHAAERPLAHLGRLAWRAAGLLAVAVLAYLPTLLHASLLDGEADAMKHLQAPAWAPADVRQLPLSLTHYPASTPQVLRHLVKVEARLADDPLYHHAVGLCLHAAAAVLLWAVLRRLSRPGAWLAAAAFAADPGSAAAVEWVGQRGRLWAACLALLGVGLLLRSLGVPARPLPVAEADEDDEPTGLGRVLAGAAGPAAYAAALVAFLLAALVQPTAAAVGVVAVVLVAWRKRMGPLEWSAVAPLVALAGVVAIALLVRPAAAAGGPVRSLSAPLRVAWDTGRALQRTAWPFASADLADAGPRSRVLATCGLGGAFWAVLVAAVALGRRLGWGPAVALGGFALLLPTTVAPPAVRAVPGLAAATQASAAATYLLCVPLLVVLADGVVSACRRVRADLAQRLAEVVAAAAAVAGLGGWTAVRAAAFGNTEGVLRTAIAVNHGSWAARAQLAEWDIQAHRPDAALEALDGLTLDNCPDAVTAVAEGDLLQTDGDAAGALPWYDLADRLDATDVTGFTRAAAALLGLGRPGDALDGLIRAIDRHPDSLDLRVALGGLLFNQGSFAPATDQFRRALALDPDSVDAHVDLAMALLSQDQVDEGGTELHRAIELDPDRADAFHTAGVALAQRGLYPTAVQMLTNAVRLQPDWPEARSDLGVALIQVHQYRAAIFELERALSLRPDFAAAAQNLAVARRRQVAERQRANVEGK